MGAKFTFTLDSHFSSRGSCSQKLHLSKALLPIRMFFNRLKVFAVRINLDIMFAFLFTGPSVVHSV